MPERTPAWKGIDATVLGTAGIEVMPDGILAVPYRAHDGHVLRYRLIAPSGRRWWEEQNGSVHLFGVELLRGADPSTPILVCEGESDCLAAREHLPEFISLGVPGARAFRADWRVVFEPFPLVYAIGDGDESGASFVWSVRRAVPWARPIVCPEGRDLRDLLQAGEIEFIYDLLEAADAMARLEHAVLHAADLDECQRWLREGIPA